MKLYYFYILLLVNIVLCKVVKRVTDDDWAYALEEVAAENAGASGWVVSTYTSPGSTYNIAGFSVDNGHHEVVAYPIDKDGKYITGRNIIIMDLQVEWTAGLHEILGKSTGSIMLKSTWSDPVPVTKGVKWTQLDTFTTTYNGKGFQYTPTEMLEAYSASTGSFKDGQTYFRLDTTGNCHAYASTVINGLRGTLLS
jgi:hypothetical protein